MKGYLTPCEAVASWIGRELGMKIRHLESKFDVDPRRLYDVWQEDTHTGSREHAMRLFDLLYPHMIPKYGFELHQPRFRRVSKDQLDFFLHSWT